MFEQAFIVENIDFPSSLPSQSFIIYCPCCLSRDDLPFYWIVCLNRTHLAKYRWVKKETQNENISPETISMTKNKRQIAIDHLDE